MSELKKSKASHDEHVFLEIKVYLAHDIEGFSLNFDSAIPLLWKLRNFLFLIVDGTIVRETNFFMKAMELINPKYHWRNWVIEIKNSQEKLYKGISFAPFYWHRPQQQGQITSKTFFHFYYHLPYAWVDFTYFLECLTSFKFPWWLVWTFCAQTSITF